jgi:hypothetical protein
MDDALTIIIITIAVCYILFTTYKNDYFTIQPQNNTVHHLPYNHIEPPNIYNLGNEQQKGYYQEKDLYTLNDLHTLNDIDDIIHNYENINHIKNHHVNIERQQVENRNISKFENRNINKYRSCDKDTYINNERKNNRNNYANFKDKVNRNGVAYTSVDKLAEIRSDPYNNSIGKIGDAISNVYDNLLSTTYDK